MLDINTLLEFTKDLTEAAGRITLNYFNKDIDIELKKDKSPVTIADKETELYIRKSIKKKYPDHGIVGEEFGVEKPDAQYKWIIDPIDGTKAFIHGIPLYTVLIALLKNDKPYIGAIHNPPLNETIYAGIGTGCYFNGSKCQVSTQNNLKDARVQVTDYAEFAKLYPTFINRLINNTAMCRTWGDAYGYLLVATGRSDVMLDPILNIWDVAPLHPIITEAGGTFTDLNGNNNALGNNALASNGLLHEQVLKLI